MSHKEVPITLSFNLIGYRLCVLASGSLITDIFSLLIFIRVSCLHLGQYRGKFFNSVSSRTFNLVLLSQTGHNSHFILTIPMHFITSLSYSRNYQHSGRCPARYLQIPRLQSEVTSTVLIS